MLLPVQALPCVQPEILPFLMRCPSVTSVLALTRDISSALSHRSHAFRTPRSAFNRRRSSATSMPWDFGGKTITGSVKGTVHVIDGAVLHAYKHRWTGETQHNLWNVCKGGMCKLAALQLSRRTYLGLLDESDLSLGFIKLSLSIAPCLGLGTTLWGGQIV